MIPHFLSDVEAFEDVLARIPEAKALGLRLPHLLTQAAAVRTSGKPLAEFLNISRKITFLMTRDPCTQLVRPCKACLRPLVC